MKKIKMIAAVFATLLGTTYGMCAVTEGPAIQAVSPVVTAVSGTQLPVLPLLSKAATPFPLQNLNTSAINSAVTRQVEAPLVIRQNARIALEPASPRTRLEGMVGFGGSKPVDTGIAVANSRKQWDSAKTRNADTEQAPAVYAAEPSRSLSVLSRIGSGIKRKALTASVAASFLVAAPHLAAQPAANQTSTSGSQTVVSWTSQFLVSHSANATSKPLSILVAFAVGSLAAVAVSKLIAKGKEHGRRVSSFDKWGVALLTGLAAGSIVLFALAHGAIWLGIGLATLIAAFSLGGTFVALFD